LNFFNLIKTQLTLRPVRPIVRAMDSNLSLLEQKLDQLISLLEQSRAQNGDLRARLTAAEARSRQLETQMDEARNKLEQVVAHLPETMSLS
jgi:chromosome segregation ATPase